MQSLYYARNCNQKNKGAHTPYKKQIKFSQIKNDTIQSLNEVECFLNNLDNFWKYIKLYKLLK